MLQGTLCRKLTGTDLVIDYKVPNFIFTAIRPVLANPLIISTGNQVCEVLRTVILKISCLLISARKELVIDVNRIIVQIVQ